MRRLGLAINYWTKLILLASDSRFDDGRFY